MPSSPSPRPDPRSESSPSDVVSSGVGPSEPERGPGHRWVWGLVVATALGCLASVGVAREWGRERADLTTLLQEAGVESRQPAAVQRMRRESDPRRAGLLAARSLIYDGLSRMGREGRSPQLEAEVAAMLPRAAELARLSLASDPGSWQAPMLLGTAIYLERSLTRDRRLYTAASDWEAPLTLAVQRAAGHPEPKRLLASAYLESWHGLSPAKKTLARELLTEVFDHDQRAFEALLPTWLGLRLDREETFSVVPARSAAWQILTRGYAAQRRWSTFSVARDRYLTALEGELEAQRLEAETRLRLGDFLRSRSRFLRILTQAPPSGRFLPLAESVLATYPPGLHGLKATDRLQEWLDWTLELGLLGHRTLEPELIGRLLDAVGEIEAPRAALAAMLAGDRYQADRYEKLARPLTLMSWAPYLVAKARHALADGDVQTADQALAQITLSYRRRPVYAVVALDVARAIGDPVRLGEAETAWRQSRRSAWTALDWRRDRDRPMLQVAPAGAASEIEIQIADAPADGAVIELSWNGNLLCTRIVRRGEAVRCPVSVRGDGLHLLELRAVAGGTVAPGRTRLMP